MSALPQPRWQLALHLLTLLVPVLLFVPFLPTMPGAGLDPSWMFGMNAGIAQGLTPGRDMAFTLGPYASIYTINYHPATDGLMLWGALYLGLSFALLLHLLTRRASLVQHCAALFVLVGLAYSRDALLLYYPLLAGIIAFLYARGQFSGSRLPAPLLLFLVYFPFGLILLVKGSMLIACLAVQLLGLALFATDRKTGAALSVVTAPLAALLLFWLLAGQPLDALPGYFTASLPVISGYTAAMSTSGPTAEPVLYLLFCAVLLWLTLHSTQQAHTPMQRAYLFLLFSALLFLSFKAGFVRHDGHVGHALLTACYLPFAALLLYLLFPGHPTLLLLILTFPFWLALSIRYALPGPQHALIPHSFVMEDPRALHDELAAGQWPAAGRRIAAATFRHFGVRIQEIFTAPLNGIAARRNGALARQYADALETLRQQTPIPRLQGSVDLYSFNQAPLIASGNTWQPRPVFQSYSVYTASLAGRNKEHLLSTRAPDHILFRVEPIDGRLPALEDGASWPALLTRYAPVRHDGSYLHLQRTAAAAATPAFHSRQTRRLGERITPPQTDGALFARIRLHPTLFGRLANLLYKSSPLQIDLAQNNGTTSSYRFIAGMAEAGFILSPFISDSMEFGLLHASPGSLEDHRIESFSITPAYAPRLWQPAFDIEYFTLPLPGNEPALQALPLATARPLSDPLPPAQHCEGHIDYLNGARAPAQELAIHSLLRLSGWLARSIHAGQPARSIHIVLTGQDGRQYLFAAAPNARPDVGAHFGQSALSASGYALIADIRPLQGRYTLGLAAEEQGELRLCPQFAIPLHINAPASDTPGALAG